MKPTEFSGKPKSANSTEPVASGLTEARIQKRIDVFRLWLKEGVPSEWVNRWPTSLRQAKEWDSPELGIEPISSPNDFTRKHPTWGNLVTTFDELKDQLKARHQPRSLRQPARAEAQTVKAERDRLELLLTEVSSQWQSARDESVRARTKLRYQEALQTDLRQQLGQKDERIAELEQEIASLKKAFANIEAVPRLPRRT